VRQALLGSDERQRLGHRVEPEAEAPLHPAGGGLPERGQSLLESVLAVRRVVQRGRHGLDRHRRRRGVVVARAQVDHVHPGLDQAALEGGNLGERIARERVQTLAEFDHQVVPS
jgi:hypothetical protein